MANNKYISHIVLCLALTAAPLLAQDASQPKTLDEALREIQTLKARLNSLEQTVQTLAVQSNGQPAVITAAPAPSTEPAKTSAKGAEFIKWNEVVAGKTRFKLYGALRLDAIYDDSRPNNTQIPAYILSEDPSAPAAVRAKPNASDLTIHPRLTKIGLDFTGPEIAAFGDAKVTGKLEIDFYNAGLSESREAIRMRHGYLKLGWDQGSLLAGQTSDVISPLTPIVNPDFVLWGAGNVGDRRPQLRGEFAPKVGPGKIILQGEIGATSADDNVLNTAGYRVGEASGKPTLQARLAYNYPVCGKYPLEFGVWGHRSWENFEAPTGTFGRHEFDSEAIGIDLLAPIYKDIVWFKAEAWQGKNLADIRGGILQGVNQTTGREIHARGGWAEIGYKPFNFLSVYAGASTDDPRAKDLPTSGSTLGRDLNTIYYAAAHMNFDPIELGLDFLYWRTKYVSPIREGLDNRLQAYIAYKF
jgi:hypothetical protein